MNANAVENLMRLDRHPQWLYFRYEHRDMWGNYSWSDWLPVPLANGKPTVRSPHLEYRNRQRRIGIRKARQYERNHNGGTWQERGGIELRWGDDIDEP